MLKALPRKVGLAFILAFALNWVWEILHSALYLNFMGGEITPLILFAAAVADAFMVAGLIFIAQRNKASQSVAVLVGGLVLGVVIEKLALAAGFWAYGPLMPVVPWLNIGLSPAVQLALTGYLAQKFLE